MLHYVSPLFLTLLNDTFLTAEFRNREWLWMMNEDEEGRGHQLFEGTTAASAKLE